MSTPLSTHFTLEEFERGGDSVPTDCVPIFQSLCDLVLEPIRDYVGCPISILSGYRSAADNASPEVHGAAHSEHVATPEYCATDLDFLFPPAKPMPVRGVFDWIRNNPALPFHQVTLEHGASGSSIIHISYNTAKAGERQALEGATHNDAPYISWQVAAFSPGASTNKENA